MKKKSNNNYYISLLVAIATLVLIAILIIIFKNDKKFDLNKVKEQFISYYADEGLQELEKDNLDYYFQIPSSEIDNSLLLSNFNPYNMDEEKTSHKLLLLLTDLSIEKVDEYYDSLDGIIYVYTNNDSLDESISSLYENAILKRGKSYVYLIIGEENNIMEEELLNLYK